MLCFISMRFALPVPLVLSLALLACSASDESDTGEDTSLCHCMYEGGAVCSPSNSRELMREYCDALDPPGEVAEGACPEGHLAMCTFPGGGREYYYQQAEPDCP
jgi:hypothetical protein